ncbi:MAG TPA: ribonuclease Y [Actinomycetes bacterium]|nr:ribonuclease Y [Actinomycetes bacterium]
MDGAVAAALAALAVALGAVVVVLVVLPRSHRQDLARRADLDRREGRVAEHEERLDARALRFEDRAHALTAREAALEVRQQVLDRLERARRSALEQTANMTADQARAQLIAEQEAAARRDAALRVRDVERTAEREADRRAREVVITAMQRLATDTSTESVVTSVTLPGDDMKGRVIGREGRNIRAFESVTRANLIVDDTPGAVLVSCFDPVRREVARLTLEALVLDGRIHPQRIEDAYATARSEVTARCQRAAEDALLDVGVTDLHPELVELLGRLRYRTSYGQNVLAHLLESAHLAALMAAELGLDPTVPRRAAFLHDIGKALTHTADGSHALVGADVARRCGEDPEVVHAIEAHHNEVEPRTVEAILVQVADAVSGSRPGARRESVESFVTRMRRLEEVASSHPGVDRVFAMQSGREVRVMVLPDEVDDIAAQVLAREIAKQIEHDLTYPGQVKVTVCRETRTTEIAR